MLTVYGPPAGQQRTDDPDVDTRIVTRVTPWIGNQEPRAPCPTGFTSVFDAAVCTALDVRTHHERRRNGYYLPLLENPFCFQRWVNVDGLEMGNGPSGGTARQGAVFRNRVPGRWHGQVGKVGFVFDSA